MLGALVLVAITVEMAPGANPCGVIPLYNLDLRCRDGGACHLDRRCDGTCLVQAYYRVADRLTSKGVPGCYLTARLGSEVPRGRRWSPVGLNALTAVRTGPADTWDGLNPARLRYKCRRARRSCVPPPAEGNVTISGSNVSRFSARVYALRPLSSEPDEEYFELFVLGDQSEPDQHVFVSVLSALTVGSFPSALVPAGELQLQGEVVARQLLTDAELTISAIEPSDTVVSVVHGTFRTTFMHETIPVSVEAAF
jgi:hypothetical protein